MGYKEDIEKLKAKIEAEIKKLNTPAFLNQFGAESLNIIYERTKSGKGVSSDSSPKASLKKLDALSPKYIQQRKRGGFIPGDRFSPSKSNLTKTGALLESMRYKVTKGVIKLFIGSDSTRHEKGITNKEVAEHVSENGRPFLNLAIEEQQKLNTMIEKEVREIIRRKFGKGA